MATFATDGKKKYEWEVFTYKRPKPISMDGYKSYEVTFKTTKHGEPHYYRISIWAKKPVVSFRRIASKPRSERDLQRLDGKMIDEDTEI